MSKWMIVSFSILVTLFVGFGAQQCRADDLEVYTHKLSISTSDYEFWTAPPSRRIFKEDMVPMTVEDQVRIYAAKNEFEPFQVIVKPASSGSVNIEMGDFGNGIVTELYQVRYVDVTTPSDSLGTVGPNPDPLWPIENNDSVALTAGENTAFWVSVSVPPETLTGDYNTALTIAGVAVPVHLHVFDFEIPAELHVKSQMNHSDSTILAKYGVTGTGSEYWMYVNNIKKFFIDHRLTPKGPLWSGGLTAGGTGGRPYIDYDCTGTLTDNDGIWGFEIPADAYLNGNGFNNGTGFPSFMMASFASNDSSADQRPDPFCGQDRTSADWYTGNNPNSAYNNAWRLYVSALESYLDGLGYLDRSYWYIANEPQDQPDYDAVAWYSQLLKTAAPNMKLMVSEEPRPEIYSHPVYTGAKIDIWLPVLNNYDPVVSHDRELNHGEETWIYFLYGTRPPYFNPITLDHPGIESKLTGWFLWKYRIRGIAYYSMNNWSKNPWTDPLTDGHNGDWFMFYPPSTSNQTITYGSNNHRFVPSIRLELMRDSLEDYEYLYLLNGGDNPAVDAANLADVQADKIITGLTSYTRDDDFIYNLRRVIGLKNGGEVAEVPDIQPPPGHPRSQGPPGDYYINFQDPSAQPVADPLMIEGNEYLKIGWNTYDEDLGYGWYGDMAHVMYRYLTHDADPDELNVLQRSIIYDDYGRQKTFEFDLPNGQYSVTVSVGWHDPWNERPYNHQKIDIEGISFIDDEATWNPDQPYIVRTYPVLVRDRKLTMAMGIFDEYTMLNYLEIEAIEPTYAPGDFNCSEDIGLEDVIAIIQVLAGVTPDVPSDCPELQGDISSNGRIGIEDAIAILQETGQ